MKQGLERGLLRGIETVLELKFGETGKALRKRLSRIHNIETLELLLEKLKAVESLADVQVLFDELKSKRNKRET